MKGAIKVIELSTFTIDIPPLSPNCIEYEVMATSTAKLEAALSHLDIAERYGTLEQQQAADRTYRGIRECIYLRALWRMRRRVSVRPAHGSPRRPRCRARRPRPRAHRRRGGGRGGGDDGPGDGDPPGALAARVAHDEEISHGS
jgi:hypothetical protein